MWRYYPVAVVRKRLRRVARESGSAPRVARRVVNRSGVPGVRPGMRTLSSSAVRAVVISSSLFGFLLVAAVAYWNSLLHGLFGVREVTGGWPELTRKITRYGAAAGATAGKALRSRSERTR